MSAQRPGFKMWSMAASLVLLLAGWPAQSQSAVPPVAAAVLPAAPAASLVGYWKFDEGSGTTVNDASGNGNTGTLVNNPSWSTDVPTVDFPNPASLNFNGTSSVQVANPANFNLNQMTVSAWIKVNAFDKDWQAIVTKGDSAWRLHRYSNTNTLAFGTSGLSNVDLQGTTNVNDGKWHYATGVWDGTNKYLYVDGLLDAHAAATGALATNTSNVRMGANEERAGREWNGWIDDVRVYNAALSSTEVRQVMSCGAVRCLVGYWKFDEGSGTTANDSSTYNNSGTLVNNPSWSTDVPTVGFPNPASLNFNGAGYVQVANPSNFTLKQLTVAAWIKANAFDKNWQAIVTKGDYAWQLRRAGDKNALEFVTWGSGNQAFLNSTYLAGTKNVADGQWHHVAGVWDGTAKYLYVDGVVDVSTQALGALVGTIAPNDFPVMIGENAQVTGRQWNGGIDDVRVYSRGLSQEEVQAVMNCGQEICAPTGAAPDLTVTKLEVNQVIQDDNNSIPLVRGKRTVVRAYLGLGQTTQRVPSVNGKLFVSRPDGTQLGSLDALTSIDAKPTPDWRQANDTLNFKMPFEWMQEPALRLRVVVNPDRSVNESNYENNELSLDITTRACRPITIAYAPVNLRDAQGNLVRPQGDIDRFDQRFRLFYPFAENGLTYSRAPEYTSNLPFGVNDSTLTSRAGQLLNEMRAVRDAMNPRPDYFAGWVQPGAFPGCCNGYGDTPGPISWSETGGSTSDPGGLGGAASHEVGHNFGFPHSVDLNPKPPNYADFLTTNGRRYFDVYALTVPAPTVNNAGDEVEPKTALKDLMAGNQWIGPGNYGKLLDMFCSGASASDPSSSNNPKPPASPTSKAGGATAAPRQQKAGDTLLISGLISQSTPISGALDPLYRLSDEPADVPPAGTDYCVKLTGDNGQLTSYCFNDTAPEDQTGPVIVAPFEMVVPRPEGLTRVDLTLGNGTLLSSRVASAHPPTVTLQFPNAPGLTLNGVQTIRWTGSDSDNSGLAYNIYYSTDNGASWWLVAENVPGSSYALDFSELPGSTHGLIDVEVTDGFDSAEAVSANPFTVSFKAPTAVIKAPLDKSIIPAGNLETFSGIGEDIQDDESTGVALSWSSDKDGTLGSGKQVDAKLSPGAHTITLTARNSAGLTGTATIHVFVSAPRLSRRSILPLVIRKER